MRVVGVYSFNGGKEYISGRYSDLLTEVNGVIQGVDASVHKTKVSEEKTMLGQMLYSPASINEAIKSEFNLRGWKSVRVRCKYPTNYFVGDYQASSKYRGAFREMDFVKHQLGIEVQFGKYSFMVYNVCAKMTIFRNLGYIDSGIEIVPVKSFVEEFSSGVSYFEQFVWDLETRGVADIDIPVLIFGIDA
jgi:hypothetical protein